ncbi:hypothetical protein RIF29_08053 [Crotalaria pallida]|uniref:Uncharacterized protein n=1 Tax=Crotalaria pallida TaxID=3830 RepID=A0AAN9J4T8_CROPI
MIGTAGTTTDYYIKKNVRRKKYWSPVLESKTENKKEIKSVAGRFLLHSLSRLFLSYYYYVISICGSLHLHLHRLHSTKQKHDFPP